MAGQGGPRAGPQDVARNLIKCSRWPIPSVVYFEGIPVATKLLICVAMIVGPVAAQRQSAPELLKKALTAFTANNNQQKHWNWTTAETRVVIDGNGHELQHLPDVTAESAIRKDGRRCNAVLAWGDGVAPYALGGEADARCGGQDPLEVPFRVVSLLKSTRVKLVKDGTGGITLAIQPDKSRLHDEAADVRCAASIRATIRLDSSTYFPMHFDGEVVEAGCEGDSVQEIRYGGAETKGPLHHMLHKGTVFRMEYALQKDKFGNDSRSYWISTEQHWSRPFRADAQALVYMNRRFSLAPVVPKRRLLQDERTTAQEFGAESSTKFDIPEQR